MSTNFELTTQQSTGNMT